MLQQFQLEIGFATWYLRFFLSELGSTILCNLHVGNHSSDACTLYNIYGNFITYMRS